MIRRIGPETADIVFVDDAGPDGAGSRVEALVDADPAFVRVHRRRPVPAVDESR